jgi:hypothetical protein
MGSLSVYRSIQAEIIPIKADIAKINDTTSVIWGNTSQKATKNTETQKPVHQLQVIRYPILVLGGHFDQILLRKPSAIASVVIKWVALKAASPRITKVTKSIVISVLT